MKKLPPIQKILEAYTAIADNHVKLNDDKATVVSSDEATKYTVTFDGDTYTSNDNATYWQGYPGYPIIAVLMMQGRISYDSQVAKQFADVNWNAANKTAKRDYAKAAAVIMSQRGIDADQVQAAMQKAFTELKALPLTIKRGSLRPPKAK